MGNERCNSEIWLNTICGRATGGGLERSYVLGDMSYSSDQSRVILLCNPGEIGMPINAGHCRVISSGHDAICSILRASYEKRWPDGLKPR